MQIGYKIYSFLVILIPIMIIRQTARNSIISIIQIGLIIHANDQSINPSTRRAISTAVSSTGGIATISSLFFHICARFISRNIRMKPSLVNHLITNSAPTNPAASVLRIARAYLVIRNHIGIGWKRGACWADLLQNYCVL